MNLVAAIESYVIRKRAEGLAYHSSASYLVSLGRHVGNVPLASVTTRDILTFLDSPKASSGTWMVKYRLLRGFFDFWLARGEIDALPMPVQRKIRRQPFVRHVYTHSEIRLLLSSARTSQKAIRSNIDSLTLRTVLIFLYATGALAGEALRLLIDDVDLKKGTITIRRDRFNRSRTIPISRDLIKVLGKYLIPRRRLETQDRHFFLSKKLAGIKPSNLVETFQRLRRISGISRHDDGKIQPRMYDLRHTFAAHRIAGWITHGANLNRMLPALAAYMGLSDLRSIERYLSLTPERFRAQLIKLSPGLSSRRGKKRWRDDPELMRFLAQIFRDCGQTRSVNGDGPMLVSRAATG